MLELMLTPLAAALLLVGTHGYLGVHIIARGVIFVDLALAQVAALGFTAATLIGFAPGSLETYLAGVGATLVGAFVLSLSRIEHEYVTQEALIGVVYVVASAATILLASKAPRGSEHVEELLTGTLLWVTWSEIWKTAAIYAVVFAIHWALRRRFLLMSLHPEEAAARGWRLSRWDFLFYALFGIVVTSSVGIAGVLVVFTFLVIPAVIAFMFVTTPYRLVAVAWAVGLVATLAGLLASFSFDLPTGPIIVCSFGLALLIAFLARRTRTARAT